VGVFVFSRGFLSLSFRLFRPQILGLCALWALLSGLMPMMVNSQPRSVSQRNGLKPALRTQETMPRRAWEKAKALHKGPGPALLITFPRGGETFSGDRVRFGGCTEPGGEVTVNGIAARVHATGAFAGMTQLHPGRNTIVFRSTFRGQSTTAEVPVTGPSPETPVPKTPLAIDAEKAFLPSGDLEMLPGEILRVRFQGSPGCRAWFGIRKGPARCGMRELVPGKDPVKIAGVYQGDYVIRPGDSFVRSPITVTLEGTVGKRVKTVSARAKGTLTTSRKVVCGYAPATADDTGLYHDLSLQTRLTSVAKGAVLDLCGRRGDLRRVRLGEDLFAWVRSQDMKKTSEDAALPLPLFQRIEMQRDPATSNPVLLLRASRPGRKRPPLSLPFRVQTPESGSTLTLTVWGLGSKEALRTLEKSGRKSGGALYATDLLLPNEPSERAAPSSHAITRVRYRQMDALTAVFEVPLPWDLVWGYDARFEDGVLRLSLKPPPVLRSEPGRPLAGLKLILDPGHGGEDTGAVGCGGLFESDINLEIVRRLSVLLRRAGAQVEMTREDDRQVSLEDRIQQISRSGADLFLSVHNNSVPSYENPLEISGPRSFFYHGHGVVLAKRLLGGLAEETGFPWQSTKVRFHVFRPMRCCPQMPGALAEVLFLSNPEDEILLLQPAFLDNVCHGLYKGVLAFVQRQPLPLIPAGTAPDGGKMTNDECRMMNAE